MMTWIQKPISPPNYVSEVVDGKKKKKKKMCGCIRNVTVTIIMDAIYRVET